jgi:hypothetical protein
MMKQLLVASSVAALVWATSAAQAAGGEETLVLQFVGQATGAAWDGLSAEAVSTIQTLANGSERFDVAKLDEFACFEVDLVDPASGISIGEGVDCLSPEDKGDGVAVEAYSFFMLSGGAFVSHGMTSVRPFYAGVGDADGGYTHISGAVPTDDNILAGTGQFTDSGSVRVSGAVNMSQFGSGIITFDCLWLINVDMSDGV